MMATYSPRTLTHPRPAYLTANPHQCSRDDLYAAAKGYKEDDDDDTGTRGSDLILREYEYL